MKLSVSIICIFFIIGIFCPAVFSDETSSGHGIQILSPKKNHTFSLQYDEVNSLLNVDAIRDRKVVVVAIAGAFRQGKSFLMNFFLKYLHAQYKKHDVLDWLGEMSNEKVLKGFEWQHGRKRKTLGIWMWSEIFTHDFDNGEKVAIIVLDTQGIFDDKTSVKECTTIFALSTIISSVTCYNIMQNIQEDHLQHLQLFTQYGQLVMQQSNEKPFQKLLFIVRDWQYPSDGYGWNGTAIIDDILVGDEDQTPEMRELRNQIKSSFEEIRAFLMPHPGMAVARGEKFDGSLLQIDQDFLTYAKELTTALFAPEKLVIKKINGQMMRACDLVQYLETYTAVFNGDTLPEPQSIFGAIVQTTLTILSHDCVNVYSDAMQNILDQEETFFREKKLKNAHQKAKTDATTKFENTTKLGSESQKSFYLSKIEKDIEIKLKSFEEENEKKRKMFINKANLHNEKLCLEVTNVFETEVLKQVNDLHLDLSEVYLNDSLQILHQNASEEFIARKMGEDDISDNFRQQLEHNLQSYISLLNKTMHLYNDYMHIYTNSMQKSFNENITYFKSTELMGLHRQTRENTTSEFMNKSKAVDKLLMLAFGSRIENSIDQMLSFFEQENDIKRKDFIEKANTHNDLLERTINKTFVEKMVTEIDKMDAQTSELYLEITFTALERAALQKFAAEKMGDAEISGGNRDKLQLNLDNFHVNLTSTAKSWDQCLTQYSDAMREAMDANEFFFSPIHLENLHQDAKSKSIAKFQETSLFGHDLMNTFQRRMDKMLDEKRAYFEMQNDNKRFSFIVKANAHNEELFRNIIKETKYNGMYRVKQANPYLCESTLEDFYTSLYHLALNKFDSHEVGGNAISNPIRDKLIDSLLDLHSTLKTENRSNQDRYLGNEGSNLKLWSILGGLAGGIGGFLVGGPPGAVAGAGAGALSAAATKNGLSSKCK